MQPSQKLMCVDMHPSTLSSKCLTCCTDPQCASQAAQCPSGAGNLKRCPDTFPASIPASQLKLLLCCATLQHCLRMLQLCCSPVIVMHGCVWSFATTCHADRDGVQTLLSYTSDFTPKGWFHSASV